jgi:ferredoxin--NADP+ reductase
MIERVPTPWGLVRRGVAPDHPKIKTVGKAFEKIAHAPNFRLFANVEVCKYVSIIELSENMMQLFYLSALPLVRTLESQ